MLYQSLCGKHHKYIHLAIIFIFLTLPPLARASQYIKPDLQPSSTFTLDNGLQVVFKHRPDTPLVELRLVVDAGMFESPSCPLAELPHLVEHLVFMGTGRYTEAALDREVNRLGATWNAVTAASHTNYKMAVPRENWGQALDLLHHVLTESRFDEPTLVRAKDVVYRENGGQDTGLYAWLMRRGLDKTSWSKMLEASFGADWACYAPEDYSAITLAHVSDFINTHYTPSNMTLVVVGDVAEPAMRREIARIFSTFPARTGGSQPVAVQQLPTTQKTFVGYLAPDSTQDVEVYISFPVMNYYSKDTYPLLLLKRYLNDYLFEKIRVEQGIAYDPGAEGYLNRLHGHFELSANVKPGDEARMIALFQEVLQELRAHHIDRELLAQKKDQYLTRYHQAYQTNDDYARYYALRAFLFRETGEFEDEMAILEDVTVEDVYRIVDTYLGEDNQYVLVDRPIVTYTQLGVGSGMGLLLMSTGFVAVTRRKKAAKA